MKKQIVVVLLAVIGISANKASADCLYKMQAALDGATTIQAAALIDKLNDKQLKCLYEASKKLLPPTTWFFYDLEHLANHKVQKFHGKNGLIVANKFEKHFFVSPSDKDMQIVGYNKSPMGDLFASPGFFRADTVDGKVVFDYTRNFVKEIGPKGLEGVTGLETKEVKNNDGNLLFGGLYDEMRQISFDVAIGEAYRLNSSGERVHVAYFALSRIVD